MLLMHLCTLVFKILTLPLQIAELVGLYSLYKRVFPFLVYRITFNYNSKMNEHKRELFRALGKFRPSNGTLTILEIGCGTGANFEHYPTGCKVICTDPNPHFQDYLQKNMAKNDHLVYDKFVVATGEDLHAVPDNSVDVAVVTLVLCSVRDTGCVLKEAKRVLRPGGAFFFLEHVAADPSSWTYFCQHVLQPLWYYFGDGCETTRPTWECIENAGFSQVNLRHIQAPITFIIKPHIVGYAVK
ncbi:methyltransferase-like protein 7A [Alosa sapidissima]|uniref:methyltransferase-like protein 7A n=1 Tax=Alosa sapidissima TaxID=34773 RepID=UPI001C0970E6|nr:methyltransferase-like protein 7A [Alosa sapidissima]